MLQVGSQIIYIYIYINVFKNFLSYFVNSQIWLNQLMDDHHLGYITKCGWGGEGGGAKALILMFMPYLD
jgi:hypothetical protein